MRVRARSILAALVALAIAYPAGAYGAAMLRGPARIAGPASAGGGGFGAAVSAFASQAPTTSNTPASAYTVGGALQFPSPGRITALWYYRYTAGMTTSRTLRLWAYAGGQVASAQTAGETGTGWVSAALATPFAVTAGQKFIVSADIPANDTYCYKTIATCPSATPLIVLVEGRYVNAGSSFPNVVTAINLYLIDVSFQPAT